MSRQSRRPLEALPTLFTGEAFLLVVDSSVLTEADSMAKSLGANVAGVGPVSAVGPPDVNLQTMRGAEEFLAGDAFVGGETSGPEERDLVALPEHPLLPQPARLLQLLHQLLPVQRVQVSHRLEPRRSRPGDVQDVLLLGRVLGLARRTRHRHPGSEQLIALVQPLRQGSQIVTAWKQNADMKLSASQATGFCQGNFVQVRLGCKVSKSHMINQMLQLSLN